MFKSNLIRNCNVLNQIFIAQSKSPNVVKSRFISQSRLVLDWVRYFQPIPICRLFALNHLYDTDMLHERTGHRVCERWKVSDMLHLMTAAADAFDLSSAVKHVHSRFNNSAKRPHETKDKHDWAWPRDVDGHVWRYMCGGRSLPQLWVHSPVVLLSHFM